MKDIFSVSAIIDWLKTQDPSTKYNYESYTDCLLCRYLRARGLSVCFVTPGEWTAFDGSRHEYPGIIEQILVPDGRPDYRGALRRAEALL